MGWFIEAPSGIIFKPAVPSASACSSLGLCLNFISPKCMTAVVHLYRAIFSAFSSNPRTWKESFGSQKCRRLKRFLRRLKDILWKIWVSGLHEISAIMIQVPRPAAFPPYRWCCQQSDILDWCRSTDQRPFEPRVSLSMESCQSSPLMSQLVNLVSSSYWWLSCRILHYNIIIIIIIIIITLIIIIIIITII